MSHSIWIHYSRPRPHWYQLDATEQRKRRAAWDEIARASLASGAVRIGRYHVRGQSDFQQVEIWQFASPEEAFSYWALLAAAGYNEWFAFANNVGMALEDEAP